MNRLLLFLFCCAVFSGCKKDMPEPPTVAGGGYGATTVFASYDVTFWTDGPGYVINVSINGQAGSITQWYSIIPPCQAIGCANFTLGPGTYSYSCSSAGGVSTSGTLTTTGSPQCITILVN